MTFTMQNTEGFTESDLDLLNEAFEAYMARYPDLEDDDREQTEKHAHDIINNNWMESGNTVDSLLRGSTP